jgi:hypothetical protein
MGRLLDEIARLVEALRMDAGMGEFLHFSKLADTKIRQNSSG